MPPKKLPKVLVVYYSMNGDTKLIAEAVAGAVGGDLLELKPKKDLKKSGFWRYVAGGMQVLLKAKPELEPFSKNPNNYDLLFIGSPVWASSYVPAVNTFLATTGLKGKKAALFCCYAGQPGKTFANMKTALAGNEIIGEEAFKDPLKHDKKENSEQAKKWAKGLI